MREWFQLLSEKNDIIKRQAELSLRYTNHTKQVTMCYLVMLHHREKLEDLESKECLLREELRVLSSMDGNALIMSIL